MLENQVTENQNPLLIIDTNRFITQKAYADRKGISQQALQNQISRNQIPVLHIKEYNLTLVDTQLSYNPTLTVNLPPSTLTYEQIGEFMAKFAFRAIGENTQLKIEVAELKENHLELLQQNSKISMEVCQMQNEVTEQIEEIKYLKTSNSDFKKDCDELIAEIAKQSEVITQNSLVITQLEQKSKDLESKNIDLEAEIAVLKSSNSNLAEKLELAKEKAIFQTEKIQSLTQELNSGLMSKLVELVSKQNSTEQV
jgi:hypothetical protein